jgi:hypothetical protein
VGIQAARVIVDVHREQARSYRVVAAAMDMKKNQKKAPQKAGP